MKNEHGTLPPDVNHSDSGIAITTVISTRPINIVILTQRPIITIITRTITTIITISTMMIIITASL